MTVREIQAHLQEMYGVEASPTLISTVTDVVMDEAKAWQSRPLDEFEQKWGADYPPIVKSWRRNWERITPFFVYPPEIRRIIYTINAIESVKMNLRKITKNRVALPSAEALLKLFYVA